MSALIEVHDLVIRRAQRTVLEINHLEIKQGETLALAGPNGSGKTTLLMTLANLLRPVRGQILFHGKPVPAHRDLEYRRSIGLVMQEALLLNRTVARNAAIGLRFRGLPGEEIDRRVDEWLERLGISHLRQRPANQLSGGEARRVALARALVLQPEVLLMDEPFAALDRGSRARLQDDMKTILGGSNITTIFSTHSEADVQKLADRRIELTGGRLAE